MAIIDKNQDGSAIVKLSSPIKVKGEELTRVTIPALRGKHLMRAPFIVGQAEVTIGKLVEFAAFVVEPPGAIEEMTTADAMFCAAQLGEMLGKA